MSKQPKARSDKKVAVKRRQIRALDERESEKIAGGALGFPTRWTNLCVGDAK